MTTYQALLVGVMVGAASVLIGVLFAAERWRQRAQAEQDLAYRRGLLRGRKEAMSFHRKIGAASTEEND